MAFFHTVPLTPGGKPNHHNSLTSLRLRLGRERKERKKERKKKKKKEKEENACVNQ